MKYTFPTTGDEIHCIYRIHDKNLNCLLDCKRNAFLTSHMTSSNMHDDISYHACLPILKVSRRYTTIFLEKPNKLGTKMFHMISLRKCIPTLSVVCSPKRKLQMFENLKWSWDSR